mmetsp:Transcript_16998/g.28874  ORF Transcript_16998/g.28874 Transcript_16998/m.28874 type:complete len:475 (-) Transcript_16998:44-1468(-)
MTVRFRPYHISSSSSSSVQTTATTAQNSTSELSNSVASTKRRAVLLFCAVLLVGVVAAVVFWFPQNSNNNHHYAAGDGRLHQQTKPAKTILFQLDPTANWQLDEHELTKYAKLCSRPCIATKNSSYFHNATTSQEEEDISQWDAIVFGAVKEEVVASASSTRQPNQRFIFFANQPTASLVKTYHNGFFNWTMTFRRDSTIINPIGFLHRVTRPPPSTPRPVENNNRILAYIQMQHNSCPLPTTTTTTTNISLSTPSLKLVRKLQEAGLIVNKYGPCPGYIHCSLQEKYPDMVRCSDLLTKPENRHPFLLVIPDDVTQDYVPPMFFKALNLGMIPVVVANFDQLNTTNGGIPPQSYINVLSKSSSSIQQPKTSSIQELIETLQQTAMVTSDSDPDDNNKDPTKSLKWYHEWRKNYALSTYPVIQPQSLCQLCRRLHDPEEPNHVYTDIERWWQLGQQLDPTMQDQLDNLLLRERK